ncbi:MAG: efflux RND transporter periplasmic adaptor subunit [Pseudomonadota bacterium]
MKRKLILAAIFLGGLIIILAYLEGGFHQKVPGGVTPPAAGEKPSGKTARAEMARTKGQVTVSGSLVSRETAQVAARTQGHVVRLEVEAGASVKKDQVLLRLDNREMVDREAQAKAALESAGADFTKAKNDFDRFKSLFDAKSVAKKELDDATARYDMAKAAEQRAAAALEEVRTSLSYAEVRAPFDGVVAEKYVNQGDLVTPGRLLFNIYMPGAAELVAPVGEQYAPFLKEGTSVTVRVPSLKLEQRTSIREVVPLRDEKTRTITVKAPLANGEGLNPGLYGTLTFDTKESDAILIPAAAVKMIGQLESVRVVKDGRVTTRNVKTGTKTNDKIEVLSGLSPGEEVLVSE